MGTVFLHALAHLCSVHLEVNSVDLKSLDHIFLSILSVLLHCLERCCPSWAVI